MEKVFEYFANTWEFWTSLGGIAAILTLGYMIIFKPKKSKIKKKKNNYPEMLYTSSSFDLSDTSRIILKAISKDKDGEAMFGESKDDTWIQVNNNNMIPDQNPRTVAEWVEAFRQLENEGYIEDMGYGSVYKMTNIGYKKADEL